LLKNEPVYLPNGQVHFFMVIFRTSYLFFCFSSYYLSIFTTVYFWKCAISLPSGSRTMGFGV